PSPARWYTLALLGLLLGLELIGRTATSDLHDALVAMTLISAVTITCAKHRRMPLPWMTWLLQQGQKFLKRFEQLKLDHGIDLRGTPTLPERLPRWVWAVVGGLITWAALAAVAWYYFPSGWRTPGIQLFYLGYLIVVMAVWAGLTICVIGGLYVPVALLDRWLQSIPRESDRRSAELLLIGGYVVSITMIAVFVPTVAVLVLCLLVALAAGVRYCRKTSPAPAVLWRTRSNQPIYTIPVARAAAVLIAALALLIFNLLLMANGGRLFTVGDLPNTMPLTALLGTAAAWLLPGAIVLGVARLLTWSRNDPARSQPPTIHVGGPASEGDLRRAGELIAGWGWRVRLAPDKAEPGDVGIVLVSAEQSLADEFDPGWPLKVSLADLAAGKVRDRLARRDEIQLRRNVHHGLATLFKQVIAESGRKRGCGYWFAPHWWFMDSLGREDTRKVQRENEDPTTLRPIGPPFAAVFSTRARQHLYQVFRAVKVDLIYIEGGISHRVVAKVLRQLTEVFDMHAGKRKVEDHHFRGIPKIRVMLHDYSPGSRFEATGYPEPQFDDLSRARVMHIFKDRGEQEELDDVPFDFSWEPAPALGVG
ncbi:MAG: hypothetical protein LC104_19580, partial [Bacteroidales bacterium]|nr:hypothetical protein [Bacteroidales bacterium]